MSWLIGWLIYMLAFVATYLAASQARKTWGVLPAIGVGAAGLLVTLTAPWGPVLALLGTGYVWVKAGGTSSHQLEGHSPRGLLE